MPTPPSEPDTDEQEVQQLQQVIRDHRATLDATTAGTPAYQPVLTAVLDATVQLVNYEADILVRRREGFSARTATVVRRVGLTTAAITAVVTVLTVTGWLSILWLWLLLPLLAVAVLIAVTARSADPTDRATRRHTAGSWAVAVGIDLTLVVVSHWLPHWLTTVLISMTTVGCLVAAGVLVMDSNPAESNETES